MKIRNLLLASAIAISLVTCDNDGDSFEVGEIFAESQSVFAYVDSFSLRLSTIRLDSFQTSGFSKIFLGCYRDEELGNVTTEVYAPLIFESKSSIHEDAVYDSLVVCFKPTGNWVGDTLLTKTINIYEVTDIIEPDPLNESQYMYNHQRLNRNSTSLATVELHPNPETKLVSWARMSDSLGQLWFEMLRSNADEFANNEEFQKFFKGICIVPDSTDYTWGLYFVCDGTANTEKFLLEDATRFEIRLYYRNPNDGEDDSYMTFIMDDSGSFRYTYMNNDRSGTPFENLEIDGGKVYSSESGNKSYIQTGSGMALRIEFPSLYEIMSESEYLGIIDARLVIKPKENSFDDVYYHLPTTLYVCVTDESNDLFVNLTALDGSLISSTLRYADLQKEDPYYSFSILSFIRSRILSPSEDYSALILLPSDTENSSSFERLVVDDYTSYGENAQLQIIYLTY